MNKTKHKEVEKGNEIEMHELYRILHTKKGTVVDQRCPAAYARYKEVRNEYQRKAHESSHPQELAKDKKRCWKEAEGDYNKDILYGLGPLATQLKPVHVGSSLGGSRDVPPLWAQEMKVEFENFQQTITSKIDTFMDSFMQRPHFPWHPQYQYQVHPWHQAPQTPYHPSYQPHIPMPQYPAQPGVPQFYPPYPQMQYPFTRPGSNEHPPNA